MFWGCVCISRAQYDPSFSHYFDMEASFNPAAVGKQSKVNVVAAYALDLAGFEHNPQTAYLSADMPFYALKTYHGVGVQFQMISLDFSLIRSWAYSMLYVLNSLAGS